MLLFSVFFCPLCAEANPPAKVEAAAPADPEETVAESEAFETVVVGKRAPEQPFRSDRAVAAVSRKDLTERAPRTTPEALRGPGSVLYGSDAMGGVLQAFPIAPRDFRSRGLGGGAAAQLRYASADHGRTVHTHADAGVGNTSALAGLTYKVLGDLSGGTGIGLQPHSGYDHWAAMGRSTVHLINSSDVGLRFSGTYLFSRILRAGRTDKLYDSNSLQLYDNDDHLAYGRWHLRLSPLRTVGDLTLSYQRFFECKDTVKVGSDYVTEINTTRDESAADTLGADLQLLTRLPLRRLRPPAGPAPGCRLRARRPRVSGRRPVPVRGLLERGLHLFAGLSRVELGRGFSLAGNIAYAWGEELLPDGARQPLTRIPPLFGQAKLRYDTPRRRTLAAFFEMYLLAAVKQDRLSPEDAQDPRIPEGGTPGFVTWNLRAGVALLEHVRLGLSVKNLLNTAYKYHGSGIYGAGTNGMLTLETFL